MNHNQQSGDAKNDDDSALSDFLASLMDYTPAIPDELVEHYLAKSGFQCPDVRLHCKARQAAVIKDKREKQQKDKHLILTMDDLSKSLLEYGVNVQHQDYFADDPSTGRDPASREE
ncbi:transcription initiation factor TFIID subunit 10-like isoform X2 [Durio zibethinus]|uniref:Transcription initiation factor TFIID subunit 10-like isoform X2 n=1 Tax=Durio zibethinus TaxID=66656 RepID=A0A6P5ZPI0_DURZI|nr:transcription initiation factor TFIID subunit 10-like isoform X2 [Durio zibethinus]